MSSPSDVSIYRRGFIAGTAQAATPKGWVRFQTLTHARSVRYSSLVSSLTWSKAFPGWSTSIRRPGIFFSPIILNKNATWLFLCDANMLINRLQRGRNTLRSQAKGWSCTQFLNEAATSFTVNLTWSVVWQFKGNRASVTRMLEDIEVSASRTNYYYFPRIHGENWPLAEPERKERRFLQPPQYTCGFKCSLR